MRILQISTMRGPSYWSADHYKVIVLKLDLGDLREPTSSLPGFRRRLAEALPGLRTHKCSKGHEGGFLEVMEQGTFLGHVVMHVALELQTAAGSDCRYGRSDATAHESEYNVVFEYGDEALGRRAGEAAVEMVETMARGRAYDIRPLIDELAGIWKKQMLGPSTAAIVAEAERRNIPCKRLDASSHLLLGYGVLQKRVRATVAGTTLALGIEVAKDKQETKRLLKTAFIPVPGGMLAHNRDELAAAVRELDFPLVVKPVDGNHGRGITTNIQSLEDALAAFDVAAEVSTPVIVEEFVEGEDHRILVVNYRVVAAARRTPAMVTGDGVSTVSELVEKINSEPGRGDGHDDVLTRIVIDEQSAELLAAAGMSPGSVPPAGEKVLLKHTANMSTGGTSADVTALLHSDTVFMAERVARLTGLDVCGIDIVARDIGKPLRRGNGAVVEVNAGPGLRMHLKPSHGLARNVARPLVEMLFPGNSDGRIPIVAITGTNGKTTTTRMIAHIAAVAGGRRTGYTTTDGIYINGMLVHEGDCTGPLSTDTVLHDPGVDFAVLECARGGLLRAGLAFDHCDVSVVTNVSADHLGLKDITTVEEMARVKAVVPKTTKKNGYAVLNADDELVYAMAGDLSCRIALFSMNAASERIKKHCAAGGVAAVIEHEALTLCHGRWKVRLGKLPEFPVTLGGRAESMVRNLLPAALAGILSGFDASKVAGALKTFELSSSGTPGRMNIFHFRDFTVMVDYAHNPHGMRALKAFMDRTSAAWKTGIIGIAGDRRDEDIRELAAIAATAFDEIIIRHDADMRGRPHEEMTELMMEGIRSANPEMPVQVILEEIKALEHAVTHARPGSFITICSELVKDSIAFLEEAKRKEKASVNAEPVKKLEAR